MAPGCALDRRAPVANQAVESFLWQKHLGDHKKKVERSKTSINNQWSREQEKKLQASRGNAKREMAKDQRFAAIERENMRLLGRFHEINRRGATKAAAHLALQQPGPPQRSASVPAAGSRANTRLKELQRIDAENQRLLKRLEKAKPSIKLNKWDEEHKEQQKVMKMRMAFHVPTPRSGPLPFDPAEPTAEAVEDECDALQQLQEQLRRQAQSPSCGSRASPGRELAAQDAALEAEGAAAEPEEAGAAAAAADFEGGAESPGATIKQPLPRFAGTIPEASRVLAEALMAERFDTREEEEVDTEKAAEAAKEAAAAALRAAAMVDADSDLLSYGEVVQQRHGGAAGMGRLDVNLLFAA